LSTSATLSSGKPVDELTYLTHFTTLLSKAVVDNMDLESECKQLTSEEVDLKAILKQYIEGISVRDDTMGTENPLLVINDRAPQPIRIVEGDEQMESEAAQVIQVQRI
jgi:hypothetical protein